MNIRIIVQYHTEWGESLVLRVGRKRYPMESAYGGEWQKELTGRSLHDGDEYTFEVVRKGNVVRREWRGHRFHATAAASRLVVRARWIDRPENSAF